MGKLKELIATGEISVEEVKDARELIERAELVAQGIKACKKVMLFPLGTSSVDCYSYMDSAGEYEAWGVCTSDGTFTCFCNWGGNHEIGRCNLTSFEEVFKAFDNDEFASDLNRFLKEKIKEAE